MNNNMLHMKLNSAVSVFSIAAAFAVFLLPSNASAGICFLPDCMDEDVVQGDINMNINSDTEYCEYCEEKGYTYYTSGECPKYYAKVGTCSRDDHYLKCDAVTWCKNNGYNTQTCSLPSFVNDQCPNGKPYYKGCKEDRPRACREQGYVNSCSPGRLYKSTNRCPWDNSYGKCCTASPSAGCPTDYKVTCDPSRGSSGTDTCGYTCYRCCDDNCPSGPVRPVQVHLIPVLMPERLNVTADKAVINVMIPAEQVRSPCLVPRRMSKQKYQQPNAEPLVMNVNITLIVP